MRELTRSMIRFSWAMPLLGLSQAAKIVMPSEDWRPLDSTVETFDALTEAAIGQMSPALHDIYTRGEKLQGEIVDALHVRARSEQAPVDAWRPGAADPR